MPARSKLRGQKKDSEAASSFSPFAPRDLAQFGEGPFEKPQKGKYHDKQPPNFEKQQIDTIKR